MGLKKKVRWGFIAAVSLGVWLGLHIAQCDMENGVDADFQAQAD